MRSLADRQLEEENLARLQPVIGKRRRWRPQLRRPPLPRLRARLLFAALGACLALALLALALSGGETRVDPGPRAAERTPTESAPLATATPNDQRADDRAAASTRRRAALLARKAARRRVSRQQRPQAPPPRPAPQPAVAAPTASAAEVAPVSTTASEPPSHTPPPSTVASESPSPSVAQREFNFER